MDIDADNDCRTFVSIVNLLGLSSLCVAHFCNVHCKVLVSQPECVGAGKSHL